MALNETKERVGSWGGITTNYMPQLFWLGELQLSTLTGSLGQILRPRATEAVFRGPPSHSAFAVMTWCDR